MLTEPTVGVDRRQAVLRRARRSGAGLRLALAVVAVVYVVGPTVLQWVALAPDRAAAHAEAVAVTTTTAPAAAAGTKQERVEASAPLVELLTPQVPERLRQYVPAVLEALAGGGRSAGSGLAVAVGMAARGVLVALAAAAAVIAGARLGRPYRPRHARREGLARFIV